MTRPTKQTQAARKLLDTLLGAISDSSSLTTISTYELLLAASKLIGKPGDRETGFLQDILAEVSNRTDLHDIPPDLLLSLSIAVINKTGEKQDGLTKEEILVNRKVVKRC